MNPPTWSASRRRFLRGSLGLAGLLSACGSLRFPQWQPARIPRIGFLTNNPPTAPYEAFRQGLGELGYVEGQNVVIEYRHADGRQERLPELAAELVRLGVDVIVTTNTPTTRAAMDATSTIPIVFAASADPIGAGLIATLARPGGNVTGLANLAAEISVKRVELLREVIPTLSKLAVLADPGNPATPAAMVATKAAVTALGIQPLPLEVRGIGDFERAFATAGHEHADAVILVAYSPVSGGLTEHLADLEVRHRLPGMYENSLIARAGGLMSYGPDTPDQFRRAATYVDKILKGAKPADLPVEQPTTFEFVINRKTAGELGLSIPPSVLQQATEIGSPSFLVRAITIAPLEGHLPPAARQEGPDSAPLTP